MRASVRCAYFLAACVLCLVQASDAVTRPMLPARSRTAFQRTRTLLSGNSNPPVKPPAPPGLPSDISRIGVLLSVPFAWGTYAPAVKIAYAAASEPSVPGIVLSAGQYFFAVLTLSIAASVVGRDATSSRRADDKDDWRPARTRASNRSTWLAAFELGSYLFIANLLQVVGLARVPTDRAAFLVQTSTLVVPLIDAARRGGLGRLPARTWVASLLAFVGVVTMSGGVSAASLLSVFGGASSSAAAAVPTRLALPASGDLLILGAALVYSWHVIRLSVLAPTIEPLRLAPRKAASELVLACAGLCLLLLVPSLPAGQELRAFGAELATLDGSKLALLAGAAAWMGAVTTGYTIWAQSYGQGGTVSAPVASLIYTSQPLWSAAFAYLLLGEGLQQSEAVGGSLIICALVLGASAPGESPGGGGDSGGGAAEEGSVAAMGGARDRADDARAALRRAEAKRLMELMDNSDRYSS